VRIFLNAAPGGSVNNGFIDTIIYSGALTNITYDTTNYLIYPTDYLGNPIEIYNENKF
jgi:hypothetical protein